MTSPPEPAVPTLLRLCGVDDLLEGCALKVEQGGNAYAVYNVAGEFFVTDDACTHGPGSLGEGELTDDVIECNFHGGQFNVRTGEVAGPPCMVPVKTYNVRVEEGGVFIEV
jgi:nitrite reductase/ring-hydroxylating ferredoxin subunit